jgi:hypothetical protein
MKKKTEGSKVVKAAEDETVESELYYNQAVTINDNHGTIIFKQTGQANNPPPKPPGGGQ